MGFDLYCQLLKRTVARLKGEAARPIIEVQMQLDFLDLTPDPERAENAAVIPRQLRRGREPAHRALPQGWRGISFENEVDALAEEFRDRFGPLPAPVKRLLAIARLRILAAGLGLKSVATDGDRLLLGKGRDEFLDGERQAPPPAQARRGRTPGGDRKAPAAIGRKRGGRQTEGGW